MKSTALWERHLKNKDILITFLSAIIEGIQSSAAACQTDIILITEILLSYYNEKTPQIIKPLFQKNVDFIQCTESTELF